MRKISLGMLETALSVGRWLQNEILGHAFGRFHTGHCGIRRGAEVRRADAAAATSCRTHDGSGWECGSSRVVRPAIGGTNHERRVHRWHAAVRESTLFEGILGTHRADHKRYFRDGSYRFTRTSGSRVLAGIDRPESRSRYCAQLSNGWSGSARSGRGTAIAQGEARECRTPREEMIRAS